MTKEQLYQKAMLLPLLPGVYIIKNNKEEIIYIGKAKRLRIRVSQYFKDNIVHEIKVSKMVSNAFSFDIIVTDSEFEALVLECSQIKLHKPKYNILLKDDKGYSYVKITNEAYPKITTCFHKIDDGAVYIGPFTSSYAVREMVETACKSFKLHSCNKKFPSDFNKSRPCLNYHIEKCMGVCKGNISSKEYKNNVQMAVQLIKQGKNEIIKILTQKMLEASEKLEFELACEYRNQINAIEKVTKGQKVIIDSDVSQDVIAVAVGLNAICVSILRFRDSLLVDKREFVFHDTKDINSIRNEFIPRYYFDEVSVSQSYESIPKIIIIDELPEETQILEELLSKELKSKVKIYVPSRGNNAKLVQMAYLNAMDRLSREKGRYAKEDRVLEELSGLLGMENIPKTIESYDISNWGEGTSVAGMVVFENGKPKRNGYRKFKVKTVLTTDDYKSMAEVLTRRVNEYQNNASGQFGIKPDLILLDGGKGQVSLVKKVLKNTAFENVTLFGMVKDNKHRTRALINVNNEEIALNINQSVFSFVSKIQDEVHRFALSYSKTNQKKKTYQGTLTKINGVGEKTSKILLNSLKSINAIKQATVEELSSIKGVSKTTAQNIYDYYRKG